MTARERVRAAIAGQAVDRVPARFNAPADTLSRAVATHLGIGPAPAWYEALLRRLCIDLRILDPVVRNGDYGGDTLNLVGAATASDVDQVWPDKWQPGNRTLEHAPALVADWDAAGVVPAVQVRLPALFGMLSRMRGPEQAYIDLAEGNPVLVRVLERMEAFNAAMIDHAFAVLGDRLDIVYLADELGMQTGLLFAPATVREHFLPRLARLCDRVHARGGRVFYHSCGAIAPLIDDLAEAGVDILNPIQPRLPGMEPEDLARRFGRRLAFCGGMDMQELMPRGTPAQIEAEVRRYIDCLAPRFILDLANILHPDIPPENVRALYDAPRECR